MAAIRPQMGQEPPDDHQRDTHPRQDGGGCKLDRPERPGGAGLVRHPTSLPPWAALRGSLATPGPGFEPNGLHSLHVSHPAARLIVGPS